MRLLPPSLPRILPRLTRDRRLASVASYALLIFAMLQIAADPAAAVIVDFGDGTCNTLGSAPGVTRFVGSLNGGTGTHLGDGWILTANHVGPGDITLDGVGYRYIPNTAIRLESTPSELADLLMFKIHPVPPIPSLPMRSTPPALGQAVMMIGHGRDRGSPTSFDPFGPDIEPETQAGYLWMPTRSLRWGLNEVEELGGVKIRGTSVFMTRFDDIRPIIYESQAASGDSGGAVLTSDSQNGLELAGIMISVSQEYGQNPASSLYTNKTIIARVDDYADQIRANMTAVPEPSGGLTIGLGLVSLWAGRRRRSRAPRA